MSRPLRIEYTDAWYHVMNRGRRGEKIFLDDADREAFIKGVQEAADLWNFRIAAYCLMSNHYHLLIQTPNGNLARGMRHINGVYTQRFNRRHKKDGQLFRGRYKAVLVEADNHLLEALRYIHRNPLRAGMVKSIDYPWSSHQGYLSQAKKWCWLQKDLLLALLATSPAKRRAAYIEFVSKGEPEEIERFYSLKNMPSILGSKPFKELIQEKFSNLLGRPEMPESKVLAIDAEKVISAVCEFYHVPRTELFESKRGTENTRRDVAIYLVRRLCRLTLPQVGRTFGMENYSSVSSAIQRLKARLKGDKKLMKEHDIIVQSVHKSQKRT